MGCVTQQAGARPRRELVRDRDDGREPTQPFGRVANVEQPDQALHHPRRGVGLGAVDQVRQRGAEVVVLRVESIDCVRLMARGPHQRDRVAGHRRVVRSVRVASPGEPAAGGEAIPAVLAQRLQQSIAVLCRVGLDHRLVDQLPDQIERLELADPTNRGSGHDVEIAGKDGEAVEQLALLCDEKVIGPIDRALQRLLARHRGPPAARQQLEAFVEPGRDLFHRHHPCPRCRQLDRERDSVEAATHSRHRVAVRVIDREPRPGLSGALGEQRHCITGVVGVFDRQRRHPPHRLTAHAQRLTARRQHLRARRRARETIDQGGGRVDHVLAVVEHHQRPLVGQEPAHHVGRFHSGARRRTDRRRDRAGHQRGIDQRRQFDKPHPCRKLIDQTGRDLDRQTCLADPADAGQRHHPRRAHQPGDRRQLLLPADEHRPFRREVRRHHIQRPQRRERLGAQLEHPLRRRQVAQAVLTEVAPDHAVIQQRFGRRRQQHLSTVPRGHDPRRAIHRRTEIVPVAFLHLARVQPHPHANQRMIGQTRLRLHRRIDAVRRARERRRESIATCREHVPTVRFDRATHDAVMLRQRGSHLVGTLLPQTRRTLDIGEQKRHGARRRTPHGASLPRRQPRASWGGSWVSPSDSPTHTHTIRTRRPRNWPHVGARGGT